MELRRRRPRRLVVNEGGISVSGAAAAVALLDRLDIFDIAYALSLSPSPSPQCSEGIRKSIGKARKRASERAHQRRTKIHYSQQPTRQSYKLHITYSTWKERSRLSRIQNEPETDGREEFMQPLDQTRDTAFGMDYGRERASGHSSAWVTATTNGNHVGVKGE